RALSLRRDRRGRDADGYRGRRALAVSDRGLDRGIDRWPRLDRPRAGDVSRLASALGDRRDAAVRRLRGGPVPAAGAIPGRSIPARHLPVPGADHLAATDRLADEGPA